MDRDDVLIGSLREKVRDLEARNAALKAEHDKWFQAQHNLNQKQNAKLEATEARNAELEDENYGLRLNNTSGGGRDSTARKLFLGWKERMEAAEARLALSQEANRDLLRKHDAVIKRADRAEARCAELEQSVRLAHAVHQGERIAELEAKLSEGSATAAHWWCEMDAARKEAESRVKVLTSTLQGYAEGECLCEHCRLPALHVLGLEAVPKLRSK
jgi:DNA repair exonuclease SbcCD ATPase subunit